MRNKEALKPCPFCGKPAALRPWGKVPVECWFVGCENEDCHVCRPHAIHGTEDHAIAAWNTRPQFDNATKDVDIETAENALAAVWDRDTSAKEAAIICAEAWGLNRSPPKEASEVEVVKALRLASGAGMGCPELSPTECYAFLIAAGFRILVPHSKLMEG